MIKNFIQANIKSFFILILFIILFLPSIIGLLNIKDLPIIDTCNNLSIFSINNYMLESKEVSIFPETQNISCLGKLTNDNQILKSQKFFILLKLFNYLILSLLFKKSSTREFLLLSVISVLISLRYNPDISYWYLLKEYLIIITCLGLFKNINLISKLDNLSKYLFMLFSFSLLGSLALHGWTSVWKYLGVPTLQPIFLDLNIIATSTESYLLGFDPYVYNPADIKGRLFMYPKIWLDIGELFQLTTQTMYYAFAIGMISMFSLIVYFLIIKENSFIILLLFFSFSSLLAIERGQNDLLIFSLIFIGISIKKPFLKYLILFLSTVLKIYPIFAFSRYLKANYRSFFQISLVIAYLIFIYDQLIAISNNAKTDYWISFGLSSFYEVFRNIIVDNYYVFVLFVIFVSIIYFYITKKHFNDFSFLSYIKIDQPSDSLFLASISIYVGIYLIASSYDYRLIFLILCIPYLLKNKNILNNFVILFIIFSSNADIFIYYFGYYGAILTNLIKFILFIIFSTTLYKYIFNILIKSRVQRVQDL